MELGDTHDTGWWDWPLDRPRGCSVPSQSAWPPPEPPSWTGGTCLPSCYSSGWKHCKIKRSQSVTNTYRVTSIREQVTNTYQLKRQQPLHRKVVTPHLNKFMSTSIKNLLATFYFLNKAEKWRFQIITHYLFIPIKCRSIRWASSLQCKPKSGLVHHPRYITTLWWCDRN